MENDLWPEMANLITFQEINLHPSKACSNSKVFFTSDKVCIKSKDMISSLIREKLYLINKTTSFTWDFFPEDNFIRSEISKAIWDVPCKNKGDENNNAESFQPSSFFLVLSKNGMNEIITIGKGCK